MRDGKGIYKYKNGDIYDGYWVKDEKEGYGEYKFASGDIYKGNFV